MDNNATSTSSPGTTQEKINELIALLNRYIFLKGYTLTTHAPRTEASLPPLPTDGTPIAFQMYPPVSLASHLEAHNAEQQEQADLTARIASLNKDPLILELAHNKLEAEHAILQRSTQDNEAFTSKALPEKLTLLRQHQQRASQPPHEAEFQTVVVAGINATGLPDPMLPIYLPLSTGWQEYLRNLTAATKFCHTALPGFPPGGYTLEDGKWFYQRTEKGRAEKELRDLGGEEDYRVVRRGMRERMAGVLVWHVCDFLPFSLFYCLFLLGLALNKTEDTLRDHK